jgi:endonuclease/exonuclease/phosphatase family metal-dependent hydrolase
VLFIATIFLASSVTGQIPMSSGTYSQNFDSLASNGTGIGWTNNVTLPGWYASKSVAPNEVTSYNSGTGSSTAGALYSFGSSSSSERALGSVASGSPGNLACGVRFANDTGSTQTNFLISYTGEQWRNGGTASASVLTFSYRISSSAITNADAPNANTWTSFPVLDFTTPTFSSTSSALDGNASANRQIFTNVVLTGVSVLPGQEIFFRWFDTDDSGFDHGVALDNLTIAIQSGTNSPPTNSPPVITTQPQSQIVTQGDIVTFTVGITGYPPPDYQWKFNSTNLVNETNSSLTLYFVTTNQAGNYSVTITNIAGSTNSQDAMLTVTPPPEPVATLSLLTYNVKGNGTTDWSTNAPQVQAIGRQLLYLRPDIITFNEIPLTNTYQMANWVVAFLPGYQLATNSGSDGFIRSVIASRYPITRSTKWLDGADLKPFGYTNTSSGSADNFTRDLFEAQISVPGFPQPFHVFTTHLKSDSGTTYADASAKRAAEAAAITNFFATNLFTLYPLQPYVLTGDMNESDTNALAIQRLIGTATGLRLTNPTNAYTGKINTYSIQTSSLNPSERIDFIFPNDLLFSNIRTSQVFRTDMLTPLPPTLLKYDDTNSSDHLPVLMVFNNPYTKPFQLTSIVRSNLIVTIRWESLPGQSYRVEASTNLITWSALSGNLLATGTNSIFGTNLYDAAGFLRVYRVP